MLDQRREFLRELVTEGGLKARSLDEARKRPGSVCEVGEETFFEYLEVLPPQVLELGVFCFAEGAEPYLLFWRRDGRFFARQLTWEETQRLAVLMSVPLPGDW